ncbi:hypothetical protein [uncultured Tateyamaria sp.]|uniref:hypothetical protein n=1 Tax=uncultured Tateyamaria sp. TaxID=455651 RepID=UPI002632E2DA|nr:hypothetical protein [uncultured Tateyamaria sp.]
MTTVITRLYADDATAKRITSTLQSKGFPEDTMDVFPAGTSAETLMEARVDEASANAFAGALSGDMALMVVRAPVTPFGAARAAMTAADSVTSTRVPGTEENRHISEQMDRDLFIGLSVMTHHPRFLSSDMNPRANANRDLVSRALHWKLLSDPKPRNSAWSGTTFMSQKILPFPLLKSRKSGTSVISGGKRMLYNPF